MKLSEYREELARGQEALVNCTGKDIGAGLSDWEAVAINASGFARELDTALWQFHCREEAAELAGAFRDLQEKAERKAWPTLY